MQTRMPRIGSLAVVLLLLLTALLPAAPLAGATIRIDPGLSALASAGPLARYPIILEAATPAVGAVVRDTNLARAHQAASLITTLGGKLRGELPLIGSAAGWLSGVAILSLATNPAVAYVSSDTILYARSPLLAAAYVDEVRAPQVWDLGYTGRGVTVAVLDSGIRPVDDLAGRIVASVDFVAGGTTAADPGGHGTHVAGIIAGNGTDSSGNPAGRFIGVAPGAGLANVRVIDTNGSTRKSTVIKGIQWAVQNRAAYNIRILNLSLGAKATTYRADPLSAAVEMAWRAGIVVVAAAGNDGPNAGTINSPGSDPYVVTVGAVDDQGTSDPSDDVVAGFSSRGPTVDLVGKPDLAAPGRRIISLRASGSYLDTVLPDRRVANQYFRLSGTSMAAPVVAGVAALLLEKNPGLTPDQVKSILITTARPLTGQDASAVGAGLVDAYAASTTTAVGRANQNLRPADGFARSILPIVKGQPLTWQNLTYAGINWANVTWDNVTWDNVTWDNATWDNVTWDNVTWDNATWDNATWDNATWDNATWDSAGAVD